MIGSCCPQEGTFGQKSGIRGTLNYHHLNKNIDILYRAQLFFFRLYNCVEHLEWSFWLWIHKRKVIVWTQKSLMLGYQKLAGPSRQFKTCSEIHFNTKCQLEYLPSQILLKAWHNWGVKPRSWCLSTFLELSQLIYCSASTIPVFKWTEKANTWVHPWVCNVRLKYWNTLRDHILFSAMSLLLHENDHKHHLEHTGCLSNADSCLQTLCKVSNWWISLLKLRRNSNYLNGTSAKPVFSAIEFSVTIDWP